GRELAPRRRRRSLDVRVHSTRAWRRDDIGTCGGRQWKSPVGPGFRDDPCDRLQQAGARRGAYRCRARIARCSRLVAAAPRNEALMRRRSRMVAVSLRAGLIAALVLGSLIAWSAPGARWRMQFLALKLAGQLPELSWREMAALTAPGSGVWPEAIWETWNPYVAVRAPWTAPADLIAGRDAFASHCAECHGSDAQGASARGLLYGPYRNGVSDLALFQTT